MRKILVSFVLFSALLFSMPSILSTSVGKAKVEAYLQGRLGGDVEIEKLNLRLFSPQVCKQVHWKDKRVDCILEEISCDASLWKILRYETSSFDLHLGNGRITSPEKFSVLRKKKPFDLAFEPVTIQLEKGVVIFDKANVLLNQKLHLYMEGKVDLIRKHVDMEIGVPAKTLEKMFRLQLPEGYVLNIPISCKMTPKALERKLLLAFLKNYAKVTSLQR